MLSNGIATISWRSILKSVTTFLSFLNKVQVPWMYFFNLHYIQQEATMAANMEERPQFSYSATAMMRISKLHCSDGHGMV